MAYEDGGDFSDVNAEGDGAAANGDDGSFSAGRNDAYDAERDSLLADVLSSLVENNANAAGRFSPRLIANQPGGQTMGDALAEEIAGSDSFDMSVAFVSAGAVQSLLQDFRDHSSHSGAAPSHIITSTKNHFNDPRAFWQLLHLQRTTGVDVRIWQDPAPTASAAGGQPFHPKGYVFSHRTAGDQRYVNLYVGSSNLTSLALTKQREWNLRVSSLDSGALVDEVRHELDAQLADSTPLTEEWIRQYEEDFRKYAPARKELLAAEQQRPIEPNAMQREALAALRGLRAEGKRRAIIISATGTGKTYLSAFDVKQCHPRRMLYVVHQQQILQRAKESYGKVLGCPDSDLGLLTGNRKEGDRKYVFATVQTLAQPDVLSRFAPDEFDYVLLDEVHHAGASQYRKVIDRFSGARFMLGMTATPERTDGINIFELFDYNVAYEIRLQKALDEDMLCPFHYYGISEYLGSENDADGSPERLDMADGTNCASGRQLRYEMQHLASEERVAYIVKKIEEYGEFNVPVTGLVFCSRVDEARELSRLFNRQFNQQAERPYRTAAITGSDSEATRNELIRQLTCGELDYLFTVDMFNEGIDIPPINQIIMLRNTESSIVFTQQLGRGLRKFADKDSCTVLDFIGNYQNNFLIPVALYGNTGDRDIARKNLQRKTIGLSSISFDRIAKERVLASLDAANWSEMKRLREQYEQVRYELGRVPMLADMYAHDPSLPVTLAKKDGCYLNFIRSCEQRYAKKDGQQTFLEGLEPVNDTEEGILRFATEILLPGLRPQELEILRELCTAAGISADRAEGTVCAGRSRAELEAALLRDFPGADTSSTQFDSALGVLDFSFFFANDFKRFGGTPLIERVDGPEDTERYRLADAFAGMLRSNGTLRGFFFDALHTGMMYSHALLKEATDGPRSLDGPFLYDRKYSLLEVERLCGWPKEIPPLNVGGYKLDVPTGTMPIFVKYGTSQYEDRFLNPQEMLYYSKNGRSLSSNEFQWMLPCDGPEWSQEHFIPIFVMREAEANEKDKTYYYIGRVASIANAHETSKPSDKGDGREKVVLATLRLARPVDPELYRHLIGDER